MSLYADDIIVSEGHGPACLGEPLRAGQVALSGALGPMVTVQPGTRICADVGPLGEVTARIRDEVRATASEPHRPELAVS
ncbi:hypothetical protein [Streptomyces sp. AS02]|uniref:hypothetical protein n=1 Tax=Streptomyces sp. AS02 TaxID=2938946 RepID=UPI0027B96F74|nr:hypothetical protein [Streptomyces sp. AS02]